MSDPWLLPFGEAVGEGCDVLVDDRLPEWQHTGLRVVTLRSGQDHWLDAGAWELVVVPLAGSCRVQVSDGAGTQHVADLAGRTSVFAGPTDVAYVPAGATLTLSTEEPEVRVAVCAAKVGRTTEPRTFRYLPAASVPVEMRGAGTCSREVRNFGVPGVLDADSIIACEVLTPAGNWSSYPPHKHDEERPGLESQLEEIYYGQVPRSGVALRDPCGAGVRR